MTHLVDANVLLYAVNESSAQHDDAKQWLERSLLQRGGVAFTWVVMLAFLRLSTHPSIFASPLTIAEANHQLERWLRAPGAVVLHPGEAHLQKLSVLCERLGARPNLINDAHLAVIAEEHGADIASFDTDFERFSNVACFQPARSGG